MYDSTITGSGIYAITNKVNGKMYVGSAVDLRGRLAVHLSGLKNGSHCNKKLQRAWIKYGEHAFEYSVLEYVEDKNELISREQEWIDETRCVSLGYNICPIAGSSLGVVRSPEAVAKMIGRKHSPETIAKLKGRTVSLETRAKISAAAIGRTISPETRAKISAANKGHETSPEHRAKISASIKGVPRSRESMEKAWEANTGRKHTPEARAKMSAAGKGRKKAPEHRAKIGAKSAGRIVSPETTAKRIATLKANLQARQQVLNLS